MNVHYFSWGNHRRRETPRPRDFGVMCVTVVRDIVVRVAAWRAQLGDRRSCGLRVVGGGCPAPAIHERRPCRLTGHGQPP
ncbi:hypothetical protein FRAHR75_200096 [Frankia sp. Hr75.2]|nr:hypothetical protein FRAHR75_200096 [Frankia sp. Hr75.2]